jgi:hypothetical protein
MSDTITYTELDMETNQIIRTVTGNLYEESKQDVITDIYDKYYKHLIYKYIKIKKISSDDTHLYIAFKNSHNNTTFLSLNDSTKLWLDNCLTNNVVNINTSCLHSFDNNAISDFIELFCSLSLEDTLAEICKTKVIDANNNSELLFASINIYPLLIMEKYKILDILKASIGIKIIFYFKNTDDFIKIVQTNDLAQINWIRNNCNYYNLEFDGFDYFSALLTTACITKNLNILENFQKLVYFNCNSLYLFLPAYYNNFEVFHWLCNYFDVSKTGILIKCSYQQYDHQYFYNKNTKALEFLCNWSKNIDDRIKYFYQETRLNIYQIKEIYSLESSNILDETIDVKTDEIKNDDPDNLNDYYENKYKDVDYQYDENQRKCDNHWLKIVVDDYGINFRSKYYTDTQTITDKSDLSKTPIFGATNSENIDPIKLHNFKKISKFVLIHIIYAADISFIKKLLDISYITITIFEIGIIWSLLNGNLELYDLFKNYAPNIDITPFNYVSIYSGNCNFINTIFNKNNSTKNYINIDYIRSPGTLHWCFYNNIALYIDKIYLYAFKNSHFHLLKWIKAHDENIYKLLAKCVNNWSRKFNSNGIGTDICNIIISYLYPKAK